MNAAGWVVSLARRFALQSEAQQVAASRATGRLLAGTVAERPSALPQSEGPPEAQRLSRSQRIVQRLSGSQRDRPRLSKSQRDRQRLRGSESPAEAQRSQR